MDPVASSGAGWVDWPAANCLRVDAATVEAVVALGDAGVHPMLLKGPVVAGWLYDDPADRPYNDADLLVSPDWIDVASRVLVRLGYSCALPFGRRLPHGRMRHAECWYREQDHAAIDLHRCIHRTELLDAASVVRAAECDAGDIDVLGTQVAIPGEAFRLVHLVVHLMPRDQPGSRAWTDLERAVARVPIDSWRRAAALATDLGLAPTMGALLARTDAGHDLADRVGLPTRWPVHLRVEFAADSYVGRFVAEALELGWPDGALLIAEKIVPPADYLRSTRSLPDGGRRTLVGVYARRLRRARRRLSGGLHALRAAAAPRGRDP